MRPFIAAEVLEDFLSPSSVEPTVYADLNWIRPTAEPTRPDFIELASGRAFRPLSPDPGAIEIEDIAHALSNQCRFSGHTRVHYSVAEHSVRVCNLLHDWGCSKEIQLWGLLHDATEAYLVDIPSPLKHTEAFRGYRVAEKALMLAVCTRFGLPVDQPSEVTKADLVLLATEARDLMPYVPAHWKGLPEEPMRDLVVPWSSSQARWKFIRCFEELFP